MAVRCLVKFDMLMGDSGDSMSEKSERAKWRGVLMLTLVLVLAAQPGSEKFMFAV